MKKNETGPLSNTILKKTQKWIEDLNVRPETIQLLEENIGSEFLDTGLSDFFWIVSSGKDSKSKTN